MTDYRRPRPNQIVFRRNATMRTWNLFYNVCILCGTAVVLAITAKVIISLFVG